MAKGGGSRGTPKRRRKDAASPRAAGGPAQRRPAQPKTPPTRDAADRPAESAPEPTTFVLGAVPGATPGRWIDTWRERMPQVELELRPIAVATQRDDLLGGELDAALVRLPLDHEHLHLIPLYDEQAVVVVSTESHLTAADELERSDLAGEVIITPADDVLAFEIPGAVTPVFAPPETTAEAIEAAASGVGAVVVPMSLARLHQRRDAASIPLLDGPVSSVALAWPADRTTPLVEVFVGIVRGRTANSSRA